MPKKPNKDYTAGHSYVELGQLSPGNRKKLAYGMKQTEAGRHQLAAMNAAKADMPTLFSEFDATFRLTTPDYNRFMRDADTAKAKEKTPHD